MTEEEMKDQARWEKERDRTRPETGGSGEWRYNRLLRGWEYVGDDETEEEEEQEEGND